MADDSQELEFKIITSYDGQGTQKAADELENLTKGTQKAGEAMKGASAFTKELDLSKRELLESMRMVTAQFPVMGEAMRAFFNPATAAIFGLVGAFELWKNRVDEMTQSLGALQLPDLSDGIRQAEDEATAWDGIAKAVEDSNTAFNSAEKLQETALKGINAEHEAVVKLLEAQKQLAISKLDQQRLSGAITPAQYEAQKNIIEQGYSDATTQAGINARNADLGAKVAAASNLQRQSGQYKSQADQLTRQFGLGATPEEQAAQKKALQGIVDARQKAINESRANLGLLNEATDDQTGQFKQDFDWTKLIAHYGAGVVTPAGFSKAYGTEQQNITQNEAAQKEVEQRIAAMDEAEKRREDLLKKSADSAGKAQALTDETRQAQDPNVVGSVAWQNNQDRATQRVRDITDTQNRFNTDAGGISKDLEEIARIGREKHPSNDDLQRSAGLVKDAMAALMDAADAIKTLASFGDDVSMMQKQIANIKQNLRLHEQAISRATNYANGPT